jgi:hypothetical protein
MATLEGESCLAASTVCGVKLSETVDSCAALPGAYNINIRTKTKKASLMLTRRIISE